MEFHERKRVRLKDYDYSQNGPYFVTICTKDREELLPQIVGDGLFAPKTRFWGPHMCAVPHIELIRIGAEVEKSIKYINNNYKGVYIDKYTIMPNHLHMIAVIEMGGRTHSGHTWKPAPTRRDWVF